MRLFSEVLKPICISWDNFVMTLLTLPNQTLQYSGGDILRNQFLDSSNILTSGGFGSNNRAYIGILQQGIRDDITALSSTRKFSPPTGASF